MVGDGSLHVSMMVVASKMKAALGHPHMQDIATPLSFSQWAEPKPLGDKIPAVTTYDHLYLWYPI